MEDLPVDFTQVSAIPLRKTVLLVNSFLVSTAQFLNHFATTCEEKLTAVGGKITTLETTLSILEAKLDSVPGLKGITAAQDPGDGGGGKTGAAGSAAPAPAPAAAGAGTDGAAPPPPPAGAPPAAPPPPPAGAPPAAAAPAAGAAAHPPGTVLCKNHPDLARYFKLLRMNMPAENIKQKMSVEEFEPSLLDMPDAPMPADPRPGMCGAALAAAVGGAAGAMALLVKDDPQYKVYFKMVNMGVPTSNIKLKMQMEGVDPAALDMDPNAVSPNA